MPFDVKALFKKVATDYEKQPEFTILLLGQTGSGKTSFLDLISNLDIFEAKDMDQLSLLRRVTHHVASERDSNEAMASKTSDAHVYRVQVAKSMDMTIIDTPGFGDSRGLDEDEKHVARIMERLRQHPIVHCVLLVVNGRESRLHGTLRYVLAQLTSIMPLAVLQNIHVVLTNCEDKARCNFDVAALADFGVKAPECIYIDNPYCVVTKLMEEQLTAPAGAATDSAHEGQASDSDSEGGENELDKALGKALGEALRKAKGAAKELRTMFKRMSGLKAVPTNEFIALMEDKERVERLLSSQLEKMKAQSNFAQEVANYERLVAAGERPEAKTIEYRRWELVPTETDGVICLHPDCHGNCGPDVGHPVPGSVARAIVAYPRTASAAVIAVGLAAVVPASPFTGALAAVVGVAQTVVAIAQITASAVGFEFALRSCAERCPCCGHEMGHHRAEKQRWEETVEVREVIDHAALASARSEEHRQEVALQQLRESKRATDEEIEAVQGDLARAIAEYERHSVATGFCHMLQLQLACVRERIRGASSNPEHVKALRVVEEDLRGRLHAAELGSALLRSIFRKVYERAAPLATVEGAWDAILVFLRRLAVRVGVPAARVESYHRGLRAEVTAWAASHAHVPMTGGLVCLLVWTSFKPLLACPELGAKEFCFLVNNSLRNDKELGDDAEGILEPVATICRTLNAEYLVNRFNVPPRDSWPETPKSYRGTSMPQRELEKFRPGQRYRVPYFLATSSADRVARDFAWRSASAERAPVIFEVCFEEERPFPPCKHVCLLKHTLVPGGPEEECEFLFVPYSVFGVVSGPAADASGTSRVVIRAAYDNTEKGSESLPLQYWH